MESLIERPHMVTTCRIVSNRIAVTVKGLIDPGTNVYLLIDQDYAKYIAKSLRLKLVRLQKEYKIKNYKKKQAATITHGLIISLKIQKRRYKSQQFLVAPLSDQ